MGRKLQPWAFIEAHPACLSSAALTCHPNHGMISESISAQRAVTRLALLILQVMKQMAMHPLTDKGLQAFVDDWEKAKAQQKNQL